MQSTDKATASRCSGLIGFLMLQLVIVSAGVGWAAYRTSRFRAERALPEPRNEPLAVAPLYDDPTIVSDDQLRRVLRRLRPRFRGGQSKINHVDHALRFWGARAKFDDPAFISGVDMRRMLLDHRRFVEVFGPDVSPLLIDAADGVRIRVQEGFYSSSHYDHTLAGMAEVGTTLDFPVRTPTRRTTLRAILEQSLRDFSLNQTEYEWSALAYALYLPPNRQWMSTEGQEVTFDRLADRIMRQGLPQGVCYGNHRMHALVMLLRVDDQVPILTDAGRQRIVTYLKQITETLVRTQHPEGYWNRSWPGPGAYQREQPEDHDSLSARILATGHPLEWWALAPESLHPPHEVLVRAGQWLCGTIDELSGEQVRELYTYLSHAGRALALWRGREPADVELGDKLSVKPRHAS